jgi:hypothetical protein
VFSLKLGPGPTESILKRGFRKDFNIHTSWIGTISIAIGTICDEMIVRQARREIESVIQDYRIEQRTVGGNPHYPLPLPRSGAFMKSPQDIIFTSSVHLYPNISDDRAYRVI